MTPAEIEELTGCAVHVCAAEARLIGLGLPGGLEIELESNGPVG